ncbi:nuclease-related domain-containing protein [Pseudomonas chlororaphis]|uniref:nuclease-related domain-containing protein n=1 Tax=Pseudomonas chlororaphis TaxID=587753 RepID=UPI0003D3AAD2|nr:nuclease-related domain-containing protein [Pseudomonas chlororaphis]AZD28869.1 N-acetylmuramoyl-L-alanine amidase [Pseudomonas chlororaphis]ETD37515.1 NERD nuclease [Pseudomonas chlororaphis subsp. aurantiaca PB-St2]QFS54412.1 nuclease [Pseudomonas chlororaphis subsp. aurantiaca]
MDFTPVIAQVWGMLSWFIPGVFLLALLKPPWSIGYTGELLVRLLARQLDKQIYRQLHNLTLNTPGTTTQIDHIFLSVYDIFVQKTKSMSEWIFGSEKQPQWTQILYKGTFKFQNPTRQNYKHLKALEAKFDIPPEHLYSVVAFVGASTFKTNISVNVTQHIALIRYIKSYQEPVFSEAEVAAILKVPLIGRRALGLSVHGEHVQNLKRPNNSTAEQECSKWDSALLIHTVKSGEKARQRFWSCSTFLYTEPCRTFELLENSGNPGLSPITKRIILGPKNASS